MELVLVINLMTNGLLFAFELFSNSFLTLTLKQKAFLAKLL